MSWHGQLPFVVSSFVCHIVHPLSFPTRMCDVCAWITWFNAWLYIHRFYGNQALMHWLPHTSLHTTSWVLMSYTSWDAVPSYLVGHKIIISLKQVATCRYHIGWDLIEFYVAPNCPPWVNILWTIDYGTRPVSNVLDNEIMLLS